MKKLRYILIPAALVVVLAAAGCGGSSSAKLSTEDVAVVGAAPISKTQFDDLMATAEASFKQQGRKFPKQGTTEYATIKSQAVTLLVQQAEREEKAKALGITITDKQIVDRPSPSTRRSSPSRACPTSRCAPTSRRS
jgi:SurA-like protein